MAQILADRVLQLTTTAGAGDLTLGAAVVGFRALADVCAVGDQVPYMIEGLDSLGNPSGEWEVGIGTFATGNKLQRTTVQASSNAGAAVNFTAGTKNVALSILAAQFAATKAISGQMKLPNGMIMKWGVFTGSTSGPTTVTFAEAFPTALLQVVVSPLDSGPSFANWYSGSPSQFLANCWNLSGGRVNSTVSWIAIGY